MKTGISFQTIELAMNNFCVLKCPGCGSLGDDFLKRQEINIEKVVEKLKHYSIEKFVLCGNSGEPVEHSSIHIALCQLVEHFPQAKIHISTNGEKLFENIPEVILQDLSRSILIQVSLDGPNQKIHELTRIKGNFNNVMLVLKKLKYLNVPFEVVYTRHRDNEGYALETANLIKNDLDMDLLFRDTTIITNQIRPPRQLSQKGNVSVLYKPYVSAVDEANEYTPQKNYLYVNYNGECYPCVSFVKHKTTVIPPNIYDDESWIEFTRKFMTFQNSFCQTYQLNGDLRQCMLNCGVYTKFQYDNSESLGAM